MDTVTTVVLHCVAPVTLVEQLRAVAQERDRSLSAELRQAVKAHVAQAEHAKDEADA